MKLKLLALIAVVLLVLAFYKLNLIQKISNLNSNPTRSATETPIYSFKARVEYLTGTAWKTENGRKVQLLEDDVLDEGAVVSTDTNTRVVLAVDDGSVLRIGDSTQIALSELKPASIIVNEGKGELFARVNKDAQHLFVVDTGNIKVKSLGTAFSVEKGSDVKVKVFKNQVEIENSDSTKTVVNENKSWEGESKNVKDIDQKEVDDSKFLSWSVKEEAIEPVKKEEPTEPKENASLSLNGSAVDGGIRLSWSVSGLDTAKGFKVVKSSDANPEYPGDSAVLVGDRDARSYTWNIKDGKTWHFRVCQYNGESCGFYSNDISVKAPEESSDGEGESDEVSSIKISVDKKSDSKVDISWSVEGKSDLGFKVLWSKNESPTYPLGDGDKYHYLTDPKAREDTINDLDSGHKYYFRVCEYLGGKCGKYSNEVSVEM